jgi:hypothetical protein
MENSWASFVERTAAFRDGLLVDVAPLAAEVGLPYPTALTRGVWSAHVNFGNRFQGSEEATRVRRVLKDLCRSLPRDFGEEPCIEVRPFAFHPQGGRRAGQRVILAFCCEHHDDASGFMTVNLVEELPAFLYSSKLRRLRLPGR